MDLEQSGYRKFQLDPIDLLELSEFFRSEDWTMDPDFGFKAIPKWANRLFSKSNLPETFETCCEKNCPFKYKEWVMRMIGKYTPEALEVAAIDRLDVMVWNGATNTGWHTDNDGTGAGAEYVILFYHVPHELLFGDGATLSIAHKKLSGREVQETLVPVDGASVLLKIDNDRFEHKADQLSNNAKDHFTLMVGVVPHRIESKKKYHRSI